MPKGVPLSHRPGGNRHLLAMSPDPGYTGKMGRTFYPAARDVARSMAGPAATRSMEVITAFRRHILLLTETAVTTSFIRALAE